MSSGDESLLKRRALAAARKEREEREEREAREEAGRRDREEREERRKAEIEWNLRSGAARKLAEILGYRTEPSAWEIGTKSVYREHDGGWDKFDVAYITLMEVRIRGTSGGLEVNTGLASWTELTMASFGRALEYRQQGGTGHNLHKQRPGSSGS
jgi:hypothetical protein